MAGNAATPVAAWRGLVAAVAVAFLSACAQFGDFSHHDGAKAVIQSLQRSAYDLDVSRLKRSDEQALQARLAVTSMSACKFPRRPMMDAYRYAIYVDHLRREYWIRRTGGFSPVDEVYGPSPLPDEALAAE
jgi:hypothetical protein